MTNVQDGVQFNYTNQGMEAISWTDPNYGNAWLVLDRNADGTIDNGTELFGNLTPQPPVSMVARNGFKALELFDLSENGGNGNGLIDPGDSVFARLRLWIDSNHNGISEPNELHTLSEFGIGAIDLHYTLTERTDRYGNKFRYQSRIIEKDGHPGQRTIWDIVLLHGPAGTAQVTNAASCAGEINTAGN